MYHDHVYDWLRPVSYDQYFMMNQHVVPYFQSPYYQPFMNPYPQPYPSTLPMMMPKGSNPSLLSSFKKADGQMDFNKMIDTAGQVVQTMNQMSSLLKGVTQIFKA
ncbi:hypothetical protein CX649_10145 [Bacillaceae bacterium ZC4]|jgi:hypothetical protein|uniref:Uncharacterized protein n=3 Tax=Aeribacillus TaxID=1055323 RepID=A0A163XP32_9BACI|nr:MULTISPECIES: YppG family protein [Aeribacillus]AXI39972.1 hypothetical protein CX649_10145 [Bacillaceae bacterium ZC4]KZM52658.1 hypothetical protein A3Q35_03585 [Aeribacillus pallidus]KZN95806.1 hypothetical protein AZI98_12080 [Aeribacillus pallidus]RZI53094.1 hypothetical protein EW027_01125 [Aeribacillus pallidus]BBU39963.1 hypothetical protein APP_22550 [Aeribacillus pallidus]